jgi:hypothetical protein
MSMLRTATRINEALGIPEPKTRKAYRDIRAALVKTVQEVHPTYEIVKPHLGPMYRFMKPFDTVLSLNYDLTVYWAMLEGNRQLGQWFKDCFVTGGIFNDDWESLRAPYGAAGGATLVFYPHGNLTLATDVVGWERKLAAGQGGNSILTRILDAWKEGEKLPLFVSEGGTKQKHTAILRSGYLSTVYSAVMSDLGDSLAIFGANLGAVDDHLLGQACRSVERIAKSVWRGPRTVEQVQAECLDFKTRAHKHNAALAIEFFDSDSDGCWLKA